MTLEMCLILWPLLGLITMFIHEYFSTQQYYVNFALICSYMLMGGAIFFLTMIMFVLGTINGFFGQDQR